MRVLAGYLAATRAERLVVAGHDVLRDSMKVRRAIGYLPESVPLYPELRVDEMMRFHGRLHRMDRSALRTRIPEVLERVGIRDRAKQLVGQLSRGLKQRAGLAVALLPDPEVLVLDEPTSGLDPIQRREVRELIGELADERTVLLSTHILAEIESVAPRVIVIHEGKKVADGAQAELGASLGGGHFIVEAMSADPPEEMAGLLRTLPGVESVDVGERIGIHQGFVLRGEGDLREDIGALAMTRGWALRELTWKRPTLEDLFMRLVVGGGLDEPLAEESAPPPAAPAAALPPEPVSVTQPLPLGTPGDAAPKTIYSLNPFDRGAMRDLSKPVSVEPTLDLEDGGDATPSDDEGDRA
ncbi:MAG: ABC transporter ATP-binding protein, partial [Planctomycetota bacterium]